MFIGDFEKSAPWSDSAVKGCKRFLDRIWYLAEVKIEGSEDISAENAKTVHQTIKKVGEDIESMKFNTAIASMMTLVNQLYEHAPSRGVIRVLLSLLSPYSPHIAEELWELQGLGGGMVCRQSWPQYDESKMRDEEKEIAVQINGKLRSTVTVPTDCDNETAQNAALEDPKIVLALGGMNIMKIIVVKNKIVNIVARPK
jgi:leucyl-tRNA synthetase